MQTLRKNQDPFTYLVLPWIVFSILYWVTAYFKPFHADEFFSWVYTERCSFWEIITLKDTGIGHPPLFHLLQKIVQTCFPVYHPMQVRLVNYVAGSVFIVLLSRVLKREHPVAGFFLGVASSACVLNIFVFSRMWGVACLASLLLLWSGENYVKEGTHRNLIWFAATALFGFVSNYSFILLTPYMIMVAFSNSKHFDVIKRIGFCLAIFAGLLSFSIFGVTRGWNYTGWFLAGSIPKLPFETVNLLLNFWFMEPFVLSLLVFTFAYYLRWIKSPLQERTKWHKRHEVLGVGICLVLVEAACQYLGFRIRYASLLSILVILFFYFRMRRAGRSFISENKNRLVTTCIAGMVLLLILSPFVWRNVREARFLIVLLPFLLALMYTTLQRTVLLTFSVLLSVSGLLYVTSNGIADYFPSKSLENHHMTVYQSTFAYSDRYLRFDEISGAKPYFTDLSPFASFCRVCQMGTDTIPYDKLDSLTIVAWSEWKPTNIPSDFICAREDLYGLSWTDRFQFRYFKPIYPRHFSIHQCEKATE
jgi:hypothetical protein